ncbi:hypothetical protein APUTEX25_004593 [Auxenochlorella protothecoides]|uniref:Uncharacterized protein n=1 Tax=Auxenochlorella protothecoides TaxID=3075 RepID=A0A3M7L1V3_AUXPR|nr:hypothetical protein APUTEX25_004593 [Auxenochlorella protothecoides]|eukprot:RMZ56169.1 hypothetical protein APUTEX25_004593 [Auxenochlorella protothecoides]
MSPPLSRHKAMANARGRAPTALVVVGALACLLGLASGARGSLSHSRTLLMDSALFSGRKIGERAGARQQDTLFSGTGGALLQTDSQGQGGGKGVPAAAAAGAGAALRHPPRDPSPDSPAGRAPDLPYLAQRDVEGINWVEGRIADRVAQDGVLAEVNAQRPMFAQFPFECDVVGGITGRPQRVVVAHKGYLRTDAADLTVLPATEAKAYFGPSADQAARCTRSDLYPLTPYDAYWKYYRTPLMTGNSYLWDRHKASAQAPLRGP